MSTDNCPDAAPDTDAPPEPDAGDEVQMLDLDYLLVVETLDYPFYLAQLVPQVKIRDPAEHFLTVGWTDWLDPRPDFSTSYYLVHNPDVREAGVNPLLHYLKTGQAEGRPAGNWGEAPHRDLVARHVDVDHYLGQLPDHVRVTDPVGHFLNVGWHRGLNPTPDFDTGFYLQRHPDVRRAGCNPFVHYLLWGRAEGRPRNRSELAGSENPAAEAGA